MKRSKYKPSVIGGYRAKPRKVSPVGETNEVTPVVEPPRRPVPPGLYQALAAKRHLALLLKEQPNQYVVSVDLEEDWVLTVRGEVPSFFMEYYSGYPVRYKPSVMVRNPKA